MKIQPITLNGAHVRLEPMCQDHLPALCEVGLEPSLWELTANIVRNESDLERYVRAALSERALEKALPFVTIEGTSDRVVGSTRFGNIDAANRKVEIGWTWINPQWQRTAVNTEAKLLMFTHAFETWNCIRVELKTDARNERSRKAMLRIGCVEEGTLRNHMITESGRIRDSVYFSIIESEWPAVKERLRSKLKANSK